MMKERNISDYFKKAAMYDLLAQFYKYSSPPFHIHYYLKHLKYVNKAITLGQTESGLRQRESVIRVLHAYYDSPNIDLYLNGKRIIKNLPFKNVSKDFPLAPGKYQVDIYPAGNMIDSILNKKVTIEPGKSYTLTTINHVKRINLLIFENLPDVPAGESKVRFIHLSPDTGNLDIAVKNRDVIFPNITYKQATDYLGLTPMTVDLEARAAGSKNIILSMPKLQFKANESYTIVFVGFADESPELQIVSIKD
ncbi:DUF4397 domain-containing protein [Neobacillus fumarioli]|uniref:DUF4397 domain-containing protein n=1 Tax=Neobacillus fumarioli TaxID=105229 RepID=UPI00082CA585|nr:DUF4397 domain-containing protein [Neobacillus fumarioli]